ncbi:hypothetical protein KIPB_014177, partial [Kipferlia bialata]|eukprot:g14177.t1
MGECYTKWSPSVFYWTPPLPKSRFWNAFPQISEEFTLTTLSTKHKSSYVLYERFLSMKQVASAVVDSLGVNTVSRFETMRDHH